MISRDTQPRNCLHSLWQSIEESGEGSEAASSSSSSSSAVASSFEKSAQSVNWMIENRGGFAILAGLMMVPSQFLGPDLDGCHDVIKSACEKKHADGYTYKAFTIQHQSEDFHGVICYPPQWNELDYSQCVLFHNPNGVTVAQFFEEGALSWTAKKVMELKQCPIIFYDYRGTGLNQGINSSSSFSFRPTYESVVVDGLAVLNYASELFQRVDVWGSSLGGGVATASLERYLEANPGDMESVSLINHDSFTTTSRVVMPGWPKIADWLGWIVGGTLDAEGPMESLIERGVKVTVLCHNDDPVIPAGSRMAEFALQHESKEHVAVFISDRYGHANLSRDMIQALSHK